LDLVLSNGDKLSSLILLGSNLWFHVQDKESLVGMAYERAEPVSRAWCEGGADRRHGRAARYAGLGSAG
jgi:hypothetical protein